MAAMKALPRLSFLTIGILTALIIGGLSSANAQAVGSLELVAQSSWVDDGGIFNAQVRVAGADAESSVAFRVLTPWESRDQFIRGDTSEFESLLELDPIVLSDVQATSNEVLSLELEVGRQANRAIDEDRQDPIPRLDTDASPGIYPLEVSLLTAEGEPIDTFMTSIIYLPRSALRAPLATSVVLESQLESTIDTEGASTLIDEDIAELSMLVDAVSLHPNGRVAISVTGETLLSLDRSELEGADEILTTIGQNFTSQQLIPQSFTNIEDQAWIDAGLTSQLVERYWRSSTTTTELTGIEPDRSVIVLDTSLTSDGLAELSELGIAGVLVQPNHVEPLDPELFPESPATRFLIPTPGIEPIPALAFDADLDDHFVSPDSPPLAANRLLADLTLLSLQNPDLAQGVVVRPPIDWIPEATFLNVVLSGLERIPTLRGASPQQVLSNTAFTPARGIDSLSPPLRRELIAQRAPVDLRSFRTEFSQAQSTIDAWSTVIPSDTQSLERLDELLELSTSSDHTEIEQAAYIDQIYQIIDTQKTDSITTREAETITLTGRTADVPVLIDNNLDTNTSVVLLLDSEKLDFPEGREVEAVLVPGSNRIEVPIEARGSGDSPIRIQVFSPDRSILLGSSEILIRTFAFSGVGVLIGVISIIVLLVWWLRHLRTSRDKVEAEPVDPDSKDSGELIGV